MHVEDTRKEWTTQFDALRARQAAAEAGPGVALPSQLHGKSGLQVLQALLAGELPYPHIGATMDFALVQVERGTATFQGTPQRMHYNPLGSVHGGWFATLLDSALGCAVHSMLEAGQGYTTAEVGLHVVRSANDTTGPLRAIGTVLHCGRQLATAQARIVGPDGKLYAHGSTTCLVFPIPQR